MPIRLCNEIGCPNRATARGKCDEHRKAIERERSQQRRADNNKKFYDRKRWQITRRHQLFTTPLCERCGNLAEHVHHDPTLEQLLAAGRNPYDPQVLHSLCKPCHTAVTRAEQRHSFERESMEGVECIVLDRRGYRCTVSRHPVSASLANLTYRPCLSGYGCNRSFWALGRRPATRSVAAPIPAPATRTT
jgi:hypothetical protein